MANLTPVRAALRPTGAFVAVVVALALLVRTPSYVHQLFDPDEAAIAAQGISLREGGTLYVDAIDRKPPLPPLLYEASFRLTGGNDLRPLHLLAALGLAGAAVALGLDARRRHGERAGWWAALLAVGGAVAFFPVDAQAANYAHLALFPGALAVVWARRGTTASSAGAGLALGVAILCRQSWLAGVIPGLVAAWWPAGGSGPTAGARPDGAGSLPALGRQARALRVVAFGAGTAAAVLAAGVVVPFSDFWSWTFSGTGGYVLSEVEAGATLGRFGATVGLFVAFHVTLVVAVLAAGRDRWRDRWGWRADLDLWLWVGAGCAAVVAGFRFFGHYWLQVLPPAVVLAAPVLARVAGRRRAWALAGVAVPSALAVLFAFTPSSFRELPDPDPVVAYVRANTLPGEAVLIWGNFPEVHWRADRLPGGGLVHSDFVTGRSGGRDVGRETLDEASPGAMDAMMRAVRRNPPRLVLDTAPAGLRDYDAYPLSSFPRVHRFVTEHYELTTTIDGIEIWTRVDRAGSDAVGAVAWRVVTGEHGAAGDPVEDDHRDDVDDRIGTGGPVPEETGSVGGTDTGALAAGSGSSRRGGSPPGGPPPPADDPVPSAPPGPSPRAGPAAAGSSGSTGSTGSSGSTPPAAPPAPTASAPPPTTAAAVASTFRFEVHPIDAGLAARMAPSWRPGCPVPLHDLRYLRLTHWDFGGVERLGELVVHADAVGAVQAAFRRLHEIGFPVRSMRLVDDFGGNDDASMAADNTSAFNCRPVAGTSTWSQHSYGRAIDINPLENPYVTSGGIYPPAGTTFAARTGATGQLMAGTAAVRAFTDHGWGWGGNWSSAQDYQHVSASGR